MKMNSKHTPQPCNFDHNLECLICDCWIDSCGFKRLIHEDYKYENRDELIELFKPTFDEFFEIYDLGYGAGTLLDPSYKGKYSFIFAMGYSDALASECKFVGKLEMRDELMDKILSRLQILETFSNC